MLELQVLAAGPLSTVQDLGRYGYQEIGLPPSGALDDLALQLGNSLLGNSPGEAGLEMTLVGGTFQCLSDGLVAITGADMGARINDRPAPLWETLALEAGSTLKFGMVKKGCRGYLTFAGGLDLPSFLGSKSTYLRGRIGGFEGRKLEKGDSLRGRGSKRDAPAGLKLPADFLPPYGPPWDLRVVLGPQKERFAPEGIQTFLQTSYRLSPNADRMGARLEGGTVRSDGALDIISDPIPPGAVQIAGDGLPIIMLADRQTTGGYAKIATVISVDLWKLGQAKPGDSICFRSISLGEARELYRLRREFLHNFNPL